VRKSVCREGEENEKGMHECERVACMRMRTKHEGTGQGELPQVRCRRDSTGRSPQLGRESGVGSGCRDGSQRASGQAGR
jgi:hypothetical protein